MTSWLRTYRERSIPRQYFEYLQWLQWSMCPDLALPTLEGIHCRTSLHWILMQWSHRTCMAKWHSWGSQPQFLAKHTLHDLSPAFPRSCRIHYLHAVKFEIISSSPFLATRELYIENLHRSNLIWYVSHLRVVEDLQEQLHWWLHWYQWWLCWYQCLNYRKLRIQLSPGHSVHPPVVCMRYIYIHQEACIHIQNNTCLIRGPCMLPNLWVKLQSTSCTCRLDAASSKTLRI